jgi:hypothetical protein
VINIALTILVIVGIIGAVAAFIEVDYYMRPWVTSVIRRACCATTASSNDCHAQRDGDCHWPKCPQLRDGEPHKSGRHCPLDILSEDR